MNVYDRSTTSTKSLPELICGATPTFYTHEMLIEISLDDKNGFLILYHLFLFHLKRSWLAAILGTPDFNGRRAIYGYGRLDKIVGIGLVDIVHIFLGITVDIWEPGAVDLYHDTVSLFEGMQNIL